MMRQYLGPAFDRLGELAFKGFSDTGVERAQFMRLQ